MPIEIRELVIRATVEGGEGAPQPCVARAGGGGGEDDQQQIIEECVAQVMKILERKGER